MFRSSSDQHQIRRLKVGRGVETYIRIITSEHIEHGGHNRRILYAQDILIGDCFNAREVDEFSLWKDATPFVFLNGNKSSEHSRYDAAHELGHLVLHRHGPPQCLDAEREADAFASEFLMPKASVIAHATRNPSLPDRIKLKAIWTVSVAALNRRLHSVGMTSEWQYRTLCIEIAKKGYRTYEPREAPRETSHILPSVFGCLHEDGISRAEVARLLSIPRAELEQLMFGLAMTSIEGGRKKTATRAKLTLIK